MPLELPSTDSAHLGLRICDFKRKGACETYRNRIAVIYELTTSDEWNYVPTENNLVDFVSRGMDPSKMKTCGLWWNGPAFRLSDQYPKKEIHVSVIKDEYQNEFKNCSAFANFYLDSSNNSFVKKLLNLGNPYLKQFVFKVLFVDLSTTERATKAKELDIRCRRNERG
ncbi:hypothetical protein NPIL_407011 [Nephila pilipes]|uniref:Uncharacterized protein n=1 Tax=Nephila pilipes TaxID=299642 RepID=A0A8X6P940_NEPPI|nr:hypothetical protein NPIL_407011 [Nephila pilipes]